MKRLHVEVQLADFGYVVALQVVDQDVTVNLSFHEPDMRAVDERLDEILAVYGRTHAVYLGVLRPAAELYVN